LRDVTTNNQTSPVFEELTADNKVVWKWSWTDFVKPPANATGDWCHGNSVTVDVEKDVVYANCRWMGLVKTTYKNPTFQWHLPAAYGAKGLGNMTFSPASSQYDDTHDPEIHDDGTIIFFDNGGWDGQVGEDSNPNGFHSRAVEYKIDETAKTATLVWEFPGNFNVDSWYKTNFYCPAWGDADRLANGNVLITAGVRYTKVQSRVFEVTKQDGKVVWEFKLPLLFGAYRAERLSPPPVVHAIK
jgi:outer membrane protein assembly factor BamB